MNTKKVLFITQEINPYVEDTDMALLGRKMPQHTQEKGREIRTFMPKWGTINERRCQLHEVIRLSGMNMIIDETDHLLIIKVASIPAARMQVYFIDNDDYFMRRLEACDEQGNEYADNGERTIFYARGVLETVKKLRWVPDVIHCHGWISAMAPLYIKTSYHEEPSFRSSRVVFTPGGEHLKLPLTEQFRSSYLFKGLTGNELDEFGPVMTQTELYKLAVKYSDGLLTLPSQPHPELEEYAAACGIPVFRGGDVAEPQSLADNLAFFDQVWSAGKAND
ncbi:MAG: glycogen/starch synthase [Bacteroidaceae bacterium]|nr:glycogen/starch synthase [Bacteroidaceae bacterium]